MKFSRDTWLGVGILLALVIITSIAAAQRADERRIPYLSTSSRPDGTLAFKLWLDELGYASAEAFSLSFNPEPDIKIIFMIQPFVSVTGNEWKLLDQWLEQGGTLVIAGRNGVTDAAMEHFDFNIEYLPQQTEEILPALPLLKSPILDSKVALRTDLGIGTTRTDFTPLMTAKGRPVMLTFEQGKGRVILATTPETFTNRELKNRATAELMLNLLAFAGEKGAVLFDEWHHGFQSASAVGPEQWLRSTPGGHAILFAVFVVFIALILQGRSFGRPVPLKHEIKRRGPMEHVTAVANLNRKAGHRSEVARQYHNRLKRRLGHRYRLDPSMQDEEYVTALAGYNPAVDKEELLRLLKRLSQTDIGEAELLKLSAEAAKWMTE
ncbi:MAG: hypothetical protein DPW18_07995 [Chloroflexi bacterium]|nr:hypothetical protein [Chloroflexota bacterium]MDL1942806.1 DUF4350 domain-containing protein [Chloroflexi bacterium CFX2]